MVKHFSFSQGRYSEMMKYTLHLEKATWNDAALICARDDAHLLSINSRDEFELIEELKQDTWAALL